MIARGRFVRGNRQAAAKQLNAHLKYIEHRKRAEEETREDRHIFSKESDSVRRQEAMEDVMEHTSSSVNYHKFVLSPSGDEPVEHWREWTREVMRDLEEQQGKELHWYAVHHGNTDNPHVHVVIAGAGEDPETGRTEAVKLYAQDYHLLRESGREHSEHDYYHLLRETAQELDRQDFVERDHVASSLEHGHLSHESQQEGLGR